MKLSAITLALLSVGILSTATLQAYATDASSTTHASNSKSTAKSTSASKKIHSKQAAKLAKAAKQAKAVKQKNSKHAQQNKHLVTATPENQSAKQIVSNAFNYRKNVQASVNPRTDTFSITQTDVSIPGLNGLDLNIGTRYEENNMTNQFHIGQGWSYNFAYVSTDTSDPNIHYLHTDNGQVFQIVDNNGSLSLKDYNLKNLSIAYASGSPIANAHWVLTMKDGTQEYFDGSGDLIAMPIKETVTYYDPDISNTSKDNPPRTVTTTTQYNDYGQTTEQQQTVTVNGKATTSSTKNTYYESDYGLPDTTSTTFTNGAGTQVTQTAYNVLTKGGKNIAYTIKPYIGTDGKQYAAVTHTTYVSSGTFTGMPSEVISEVILVAMAVTMLTNPLPLA